MFMRTTLLARSLFQINMPFHEQNIKCGYTEKLLVSKHFVQTESK